MKIARIGNMYQPVPPPGYGGMQRTIAQITVTQACMGGHEIILYAPADSTIVDVTRKTAEDLGLRSWLNGDKVVVENADGRLGSVKLMHTGQNATGYRDPDSGKRKRELLDLLIADQRANPADIIHCHQTLDYMPHLIEAGFEQKTIFQQHMDKLDEGHDQYRYPVICISQRQAQDFKEKYDADILGVVYNTLDRHVHTGTTEHAGYLASIGRLTPDKGPHRACAIAQKAGMPLVLAGMTNGLPANELFLANEVLPHVDFVDKDFLNRCAGKPASFVRAEIEKISVQTGVKNPIIYVGPATDHQKQTLYGNAAATLFPVSWPEPFGRVLVESMACGAPVIGNVTLGERHCGAVEEVLENGVTGVHIHARDEEDSIRLAAEAAKQIGLFDRATIRRRFEECWTPEVNVLKLDPLYTKFLEMQTTLSHRPRPVTAAPVELPEMSLWEVGMPSDLTPAPGF